MSWDLLAFRAPADFKSPRTEDLPPGWQPEPFGLRSDVQERLTSLLPGIQFNFHNTTLWGSWRTGTCSLEINLGDAERIVYVWVAARGDQNEALEKVAAILDALALRGVDLQAGEFFNRVAGRETFATWREAVERLRTKIEEKQS